MRKILVIAIISLVFANKIAAQYEIILEVKNFANKQAFLIQYFGDQRYIANQAQADANGNVVFKGDEKLPEGVYMINLDKQTGIDIIIDNQQYFNVKMDLLDPSKTQFINSKINSNFWAYQIQNTELQNKRQGLQQQKDSLSKHAPDSEALSDINKQMAQTDDKLNSLMVSTQQQNADNFLGTMLLAMQTSDINNLALNDARLLYTPFFYNIIRLHIKQHIQKSHRYIIQKNDEMIARIQNDELRNYIVSYLLDFYATFAKSGGDEIVVHLADKYFLSGIIPMNNPEQKASFENKIDELRQALPGSMAPDLKLVNLQGDSVNLYSIQNANIIVLFWSSHCGHCEDAINYLRPHYDALLSKDIEIVTIATDENLNDWKEYVGEHPMSWPNFADPKNTSNFRLKYYVFSTPLAYFLDTEKRIVSRHIGNVELEALVEQLVKIP